MKPKYAFAVICGNKKALLRFRKRLLKSKLFLENDSVLWISPIENNEREIDADKEERGSL